MTEIDEKKNSLDEMVKQVPIVAKRDGERFVNFSIDKVKNAAEKTIEAVNGEENYEIAEKILPIVMEKLLSSRDSTGIFKSTGTNVPSVRDFDKLVPEAFEELGYQNYSNAYKEYAQDREKRRGKEITVKGKTEDTRNTTDKLLLVDSTSKDTEEGFDRKRIVRWLVNVAELDRPVAWSVAKDVHEQCSKLYEDGKPVTTNMIRVFVNEELKERGLEEIVEKNKPITIPKEDINQMIFQRSLENANVTANNPEAVNLAIAEYTLKEYALNEVFSSDVARAHLQGKMHLHDLGYIVRVYCSSHSLDYLKKYGLELENLESSSVPAKHAHTLTGHLNTFLASMQAYYAGALGVAYMNIAYAPLLQNDIKKMIKEDEFLKEVKKETDQGLENLIKQNPDAEQEVEKFKQHMEEKFQEIKKQEHIEKKIDKFFEQAAQYLIFSGSQMAFSRGGQTLFLDFNVYTGIPDYLKENPAIGPGGKYHLRNLKTGELTALEEKVKDEQGMKISELWHNEKRVMNETVRIVGGKKVIERSFENLSEEEDIDKNKYYEETARRFGKAMLNVWKQGDKRGLPFAFPKCDFHVNDESFTDEKQNELLMYACEIASENGSPYFIFDREATTLSACCRLRTTIEDDYMLKHPESLRFCGFQNVTINLPQAAYRAGKGNIEQFKKEVSDVMELVVKAHQQKKSFIEKCGEKGGPQYQTQKAAYDGMKYVDLDKSTYIMGLIGLNEAIQYLTGKELHESGEIFSLGRNFISWMYAKKEQLAEESGLKLSLEESPAESTTRRLAATDIISFPEQAKEVVKGSLEYDTMYYTNSVHFRADAELSLIERIKYQSMFHPLIESGAIIHGFVGEKRPPAKSIYNLIEKSFKQSQAAQLTISPEFTYCNSCGNVSSGFKLNVKKGGENG
jgi:anaerobic ribonucleoside-triphosphate reductase